MKLLLGCSSPPDKGSGILAYSKEISEAFIQMGVDVYFASPTPKNNSWLKQYGIKHIATNQWDDVNVRARDLIKLIDDYGINGIINNDNPLLQSIAPGIGCPFITVGHMSQRNIATLACYRHEWSDYIVAISNDMQSYFAHKYSVPIIKCPVIYNGIRDSVPLSDQELKAELPLKVVYAGGYNKSIKGADKILKAALMPSYVWGDARLDWYGDVPDRIVRKLKNRANISIYGRVSREVLMEKLKEADILLFPSSLEGCPMAVLEAMSMGVVPIVSDGVGAMRELVTNGKDGYVCYLDNWTSQMMQCIHYLQRDLGKLTSLKQAARETYLEKYQADRVARDLLDLIAHPTVDRDKRQTRFELLKWHRPLRPDGKKAPLIDRVYYRFGKLRKAGISDVVV